MKVMLYSEDITLLNEWQKKITLFKSEIIEEIDKLHLYKNTLVVLDYASCYRDLLKLINTAKKQNIKILLLEKTPNFDKGKYVLDLGVYGYGNTLMSRVFLDSALETITKEMVWIYPEFTTSLIRGFSKEKAMPDHLTQLLTSRELDIALLIKDGSSNNDICEHLGISINTVKSHIKNIYEKLSIKNRLSLSLLFKNQKETAPL
ncbi:MAG: LuxR C-terminal-related transcriptional regulator [Sulfurimonas sp.]|uniref:response regulator transcription factor n=1 Tax=Sulfurimonas sp. TaxID=2022749 RepID=UPI0025D9EF17|nr:LuxR C-terminal-related transcriptional regulator [Sulfurimonas sp.]MCK9490833.1 LuxR C-terminal-related transcriptional regulator [Sulfurimonas sp.]